MKNLPLCALLFFGFIALSFGQDCYSNPSDPDCKTFQMPVSTVEDDISSLCGSMGQMPGCTLDDVCEDDKDISSSRYCIKFSILKTLCMDMPGMSGCSDYRSLCSNVSVVEECDMEVLPLPSTRQMTSLIDSICTEMAMDGCEECKSSTCDLLKTYSNLCIQMPDMSQCQSWKNYCQYIPDWSFCSSEAESSPPQMRMYFHASIKDYVLFEGWVPTNSGEYIGTFIAVFFIGFLHEFIKFVSYKFEEHVSKQHEGEKYPLSFYFHVDVPRALLHFLNAAWGFIAMLIAMTYNVGLFIGVCLGLAFGMLIFGRFTCQYQKGSICCT